MVGSDLRNGEIEFDVTIHPSLYKLVTQLKRLECTDQEIQEAQHECILFANELNGIMGGTELERPSIVSPVVSRTEVRNQIYMFRETDNTGSDSSLVDSEEKILLEQFRSPEISELVKHECVLLVPIGSIEQHGPHLPVNTDIAGATEIAKRCALAAPEDIKVVVGVPIPFSWEGFPLEQYLGSLCIRRETFISLVTEVIESYVKMGFSKIIMVNGHGPNMYPLGVVCENVGDRTGVMPVAVNYWTLAGEDILKGEAKPSTSDWHSGEFETSLQLVFQPNLVDMSVARKGIMLVPSKYFTADLLTRDSVPIIYEGIGRGQYAHSEEAWKLGVYGDPTKASPELGEKCVKIIIDRLLDLIQEIRKWDTRWSIAGKGESTK